MVTGVRDIIYITFFVPLCLMEEIQTQDFSIWKCAQQLAIPMSVMWMLAFLCYMYMLRWPWLSFVFLGIGIYTLLLFHRNLAFFRLLSTNKSMLRVLRLALATCLCCTLLVTVTQYVYISYIDQELIASLYAKVAQQPEVQAYWNETGMGMQIEEMASHITPNDFTRVALLMNLFLSLFFSALASALCILFPARVKREDKDD